MKNNKEVKGIIAVIFLIAALYAFSWIATCGIIKLITLCFGWAFSWLIATGVWLVMILLKDIFSHNTTVKK